MVYVFSERQIMSDENNNEVRESLSSIAIPYTNPADEYLSTFPPGYRFVPTDIEIIVHYLTTKVENKAIPINKINEVNLYDHPPEYLTSKIFKSYEDVWYFYTSRDRKYRNGIRPNRSAGNGYWKATGVAKKIKSHDNTELGSKKTLVFYRGKAPKGDKTDWIMHEFMVEQSQFERNSRPDMLLDNYVLCRIYNKAGTTKSKTKKDQSRTETTTTTTTTTQAQEEHTISTIDPMEYSNEEEGEDQRTLKMITGESTAIDVGMMSSITNDHSSLMMDMMNSFESITVDDDSLPITPYISQQTYHPGSLHVQINNNYMNTSTSTSTDAVNFLTYDSSHMECGTLYDSSVFSPDIIPLDYNDMRSSLSINQQVPPTPMQGGNYDGREQGFKENDGIFAAGWSGNITTATVIPNYCQDYPYFPFLHYK